MLLKQLLLRGTRAVGANALLASTRWRRKRLLILCYHGVSLRDEHAADPALYVTADFFRRRLERLRDGGYNVLRLGDALLRLRDGMLPPRSVVITFDDGTRDFAELVVPLLREFRMPATVYVTTYYCERAMPVFDTALRYILWRGRETSVDLGKTIRELDRPLPLASEGDRDAAWSAIYSHARDHGFSALEKHNLLGRVAEAVGVNFDQFLSTGMYQQMTPEQVAELPSELIDVELHTHRHRTPRAKELFTNEIGENLARLQHYTRRTSFPHFCYPSGDYWGEFVGWLRDLGIESATTCVTGLAEPTSHPLLLPRFLDSTGISDATFDAWTSGVAALLPRRAEYGFDPARMVPAAPAASSATG